jgi:hypothetical protein
MEVRLLLGLLGKLLRVGQVAFQFWGFICGGDANPVLLQDMEHRFEEAFGLVDALGVEYGWYYSCLSRFHTKTKLSEGK